jgi:hypothetical protein
VRIIKSLNAGKSGSGQDKEIILQEDLYKPLLGQVLGGVSERAEPELGFFVGKIGELRPGRNQRSLLLKPVLGFESPPLRTLRVPIAMSNDLEGMLRLACGGTRKLKLLRDVLRRVSIGTLIIEPHGDDLFTPLGTAELWVEQGEADRARIVLLKNRAANREYVYGAEVY